VTVARERRGRRVVSSPPPSATVPDHAPRRSRPLGVVHPHQPPRRTADRAGEDPLRRRLGRPVWERRPAVATPGVRPRAQRGVLFRNAADDPVAASGTREAVVAVFLGDLPGKGRPAVDAPGVYGVHPRCALTGHVRFSPSLEGTLAGAGGHGRERPRQRSAGASDSTIPVSPHSGHASRPFLGVAASLRRKVAPQAGHRIATPVDSGRSPSRGRARSSDCSVISPRFPGRSDERTARPGPTTHGATATCRSRPDNRS